MANSVQIVVDLVVILQSGPGQIKASADYIVKEH